MVRRNTPAIVAPMANAQSFGNRPVGQFVGDAVGTEFVSLAYDRSIAIARDVAQPRDASGIRLSTETISESRLKRDHLPLVLASVRAEAGHTGSICEMPRHTKVLEAAFASAEHLRSLSSSHDSSLHKRPSFG